MAGARLAVVWCPTLGVPVVPGLALLTPGALCMVLTFLGQADNGAEAGPLEATDTWDRRERGWGSPGRCLSRARRPRCGRDSCSVHRCPGRGRWACVCSLCHSPGHSQRGFLRVCSGSGPPDGRGGLGEVGELKEEPEHHRGGGWLDRWVGPGLTWQDGPRYPGGQAHCSTSSAGSWPVSSGTATSMLMPETLGVTQPRSE